MSIINRVKSLELPLDKIIVTGSGILDVLEIRRTQDVDLAAEASVFLSLQADPGWSHQIERGLERLTRGDVEVWRGWEDARGAVSYQQLLEDSQIIDGVRFLSLDYLRGWKQWRGRDKDLEDIKLIDQYLAAQDV